MEEFPADGQHNIQKANGRNGNRLKTSLLGRFYVNAGWIVSIRNWLDAYRCYQGTNWL